MVGNVTTDVNTQTTATAEARSKSDYHGQNRSNYKSGGGGIDQTTIALIGAAVLAGLFILKKR